jgi:hypothetical protein
MTIKTRFPSIEPSLDLNFAATKRLDPRITFTRASSATFVNENGLIEAAGVNQARFDHTPTTGESLGLLVEEQRTNSFAWSNSATQGETWNSVGNQLNLASGQSDPAGGTAGIRATDANSFSGGTSLQRTNLANLTASTTVTYSIWLKPIDCPDNLINLIIFANTTTDSINAVFSVSGTAITAVSTSASGTGVASGASLRAALLLRRISPPLEPPPPAPQMWLVLLGRTLAPGIGRMRGRFSGQGQCTILSILTKIPLGLQKVPTFGGLALHWMEEQVLTKLAL